MKSMFASGDEAATDATVFGWMESIGPTMASELASRLHLPAQSIDQSLIRLETQGQVLRGSFRQTSPYPSRGRVVPPPLAGAHSSFDHRQAAKRS